MAKLKRNMKRITCLMLVVSMALLLVSCSSPQKRIIGKWKDPKSGETMQFFKDGTMVSAYMEELFGRSYPVTITGTYSCPDKNHLKITVEGFLGGSMICKVSISRNELILTDPETGEISKFQRVE